MLHLGKGILQYIFFSAPWPAVELCVNHYLLYEMSTLMTYWQYVQVI